MFKFPYELERIESNIYILNGRVINLGPAWRLVRLLENPPQMPLPAPQQHETALLPDLTSS